MLYLCIKYTALAEKYIEISFMEFARLFVSLQKN